MDVIVFRNPNLRERRFTHPSIEDIKVHNLFAQRYTWVSQLKKKINEMEKEKKVDAFDVHKSLYLLPFVSEKRKILLSLHSFELTCPIDFWYLPLLKRKIRPCGYPNNHFSLKLCCMCHGSKGYLYWRAIRWYLYWRAIRWYVPKKVSAIMTKYNHLKKRLVESGVKEGKIVVIPNWIDAESVLQKSKQDLRSTITGIESSDRVFVFFGSLKFFKRPDLTLKAFASLNKKIDNVKLVFIGDGVLRDELEKMCKRLEIQDKVHFLGMISHTEVHRYLSIADVFVFSSLYDNYNWALLEAMCTKKPIIATDVGGTKEILRDGYNALLAMPTAESLGSKMRMILNDRKLSRKIAENAYNTVKEKHSMKNLEKYEELIQSL